MAVKFVQKKNYNNNNNPVCPRVFVERGIIDISCTFGLHGVNLKHCTTELGFMSQR